MDYYGYWFGKHSNKAKKKKVNQNKQFRPSKFYLGIEIYNFQNLRDLIE